MKNEGEGKCENPRAIFLKEKSRGGFVYGKKIKQKKTAGKFF